MQRLQAEVEADKSTITQLKGQYKGTILDELLFPEGGWSLSQQGRATLLKMVPTLRNLKNTRIAVNGYTDSVPIAVDSQDRLPSNWELAAARAAVVVRNRQSRGVNPELMSATSYGETHPVAANDSSADRSRNRRIELTLVGPGT
jgi:chemotaxis protein MotB